MGGQQAIGMRICAASCTASLPLLGSVCFPPQVMGVVYLDQVEDEFARQEVLAERDPNFNRAS